MFNFHLLNTKTVDAKNLQKYVGLLRKHFTVYTKFQKKITNNNFFNILTTEKTVYVYY